MNTTSAAPVTAEQRAAFDRDGYLIIRDDLASLRASDWFARLTPVQQQLLGGAGQGGGDHAWGHDPATTPLYGWLQERGFLDPAHPPLRPLELPNKMRHVGIAVVM